MPFPNPGSTRGCVWVIGQTGVILMIRTWAGCGSKVIVACDTQKKGTMEETIFGIRIIRAHHRSRCLT